MYPGEYTLIGNELSFFTRKLEAQLRFQQIPWRYQFKTEARREALSQGWYAFHSLTVDARPDGCCKTPFQLGLFKRALQRDTCHTEHAASASALFYPRGCIQSLAWTRLRTFPLVLPGQCGMGGTSFRREHHA